MMSIRNIFFCAAMCLAVCDAHTLSCKSCTTGAGRHGHHHYSGCQSCTRGARGGRLLAGPAAVQSAELARNLDAIFSTAAAKLKDDQQLGRGGQGDEASPPV